MYQANVSLTDAELIELEQLKKQWYTLESEVSRAKEELIRQKRNYDKTKVQELSDVIATMENASSAAAANFFKALMEVYERHTGKRPPSVVWNEDSKTISPSLF
jgi:hypothetical protein